MVILKMLANEIENYVDEMLDCLDVDIEHIRKNLSRLNEMRELVIKRDDVELRKLLDSIQGESDIYRENETRRLMLRKKIADSLGCGIENITLSKLANRLPENKRNRVIEKKEQLKSLVGNFKKEYAGTIVLVSECARFNKMLLRSIFNHGQTGSVYYGANGTVREHKENGKSWLVNCDL